MADSEFQYHYALVSGRTVDDSIAVGYKFRDQADFRGGNVQSWAFYFTANEDSTQVNTPGRWPGYVSGVWLSDSGRVYVALAHGELAIYDGVRTFNELSSENVPTALSGIWGLDDQHVYAYGGSPGESGQVFFYDGKRWKKLPEAPEWLLHVHGCAPDCVYGIGTRSAYRWDGKQWHPTALRATLSLACVWVESPDEIWATDGGGVLFEGSADGWSERARSDAPLVGVARWQGDVWLGGESAGLLRLKGKSKKIEVVKPNIPTRYFESREQLLIANPEHIIFSATGKRFEAFAEDLFQEITEDKPF
jgi:hypothetical protein